MDKKYKVELTLVEIDALQAVLGMGHLKQRPMIVRSIEMGILNKLYKAVDKGSCPLCNTYMLSNGCEQDDMCDCI